jgi:hypothetical protein
VFVFTVAPRIFITPQVLIFTVVPRPMNYRTILCIPQCCQQLLCRMLRVRSYHLARRLHLVLIYLIFLEDNEMRSRSALVGVNNKPLSLLQGNPSCGMSMTQKPWIFSRISYLVFCTSTRSLFITSNENQTCI